MLVCVVGYYSSSQTRRLPFSSLTAYYFLTKHSAELNYLSNMEIRIHGVPLSHKIFIFEQVSRNGLSYGDKHDSITPGRSVVRKCRPQLRIQTTTRCSDRVNWKIRKTTRFLIHKNVLNRGKHRDTCRWLN